MCAHGESGPTGSRLLPESQRVRDRPDTKRQDERLRRGQAGGLGSARGLSPHFAYYYGVIKLAGSEEKLKVAGRTILLSPAHATSLKF